MRTVSFLKPINVTHYFHRITTKYVYIWSYIEFSPFFTQERKNVYLLVIGFIKVCLLKTEVPKHFFLLSWKTVN